MRNRHNDNEARLDNLGNDPGQEYRRPEDVAPQREQNIEPDDLKRSA